MRNALKVRGGVNNGLFEKMKRYAIPLLSQSIRRAQRIAVAMEAKRFSDDNERTFYYEIGFGKNDITLVVVFIVVTAVAYYAGVHYPYIPVEDVR